ncbi:hypothetical protein BDV96DRAFT_607845 [Lophiotrema nucula]|uniref:F-box domain-containing protein n=1 Tax=Lophiotrema nucula TaxID=690887 RepID=A0A6A5YF62_9PLEO|nr:hypothetical protein BDV96DRAFT_607845 [Lophiotrema nucula]
MTTVIADNGHVRHRVSTREKLLQKLLDPAILRQSCPLSTDIRHYQLAASHGGLGKLDLVATEVQQMILERLDLQSILNFRRVSQKAMAVANDVPAFRKVIEHCPDAIRMAVGIRVASRILLLDLLDKLCQRTCDEGCGKLAPYLDIFRLERKCFGTASRCALKHIPPKPLARSEEEVRRHGDTIAASTASFMSIPGSYDGRNVIPKREIYYYYREVKKIVGAHLITTNVHSRYVLHSVGCVTHKRKVPSSTYMMVILAPWINKFSSGNELGYHRFGFIETWKGIETGIYENILGFYHRRPSGTESTYICTFGYEQIFVEVSV